MHSFSNRFPSHTYFLCLPTKCKMDAGRNGEVYSQNMPPKREKSCLRLEYMANVNSSHHVVNSCQFPAMIEQLFTDFPVARISMEIIFVRRCKKSKQNSDKIIHRITAPKSNFWILLCNNSNRTCFSVH